VANHRNRVPASRRSSRPVTRDELARQLLSINGLLTALLVHVGGECTITADDRRQANTLQAETDINDDGSIRFHLSEYVKEAPGG
jgi:hypothetical protein